MEAFVIVALIGIGIFVFSNMKQKHSYDVADLIRPIINDWVESRNGLLDSVRFSIVDEPSIAENFGARMVVGKFKRKAGADCGFYLEIEAGRVVLGKIYFPDGITSWHKNMTLEAKMYNRTLHDLLNLAERAHHDKYPQWKDVR